MNQDALGDGTTEQSRLCGTGAVLALGWHWSGAGVVQPAKGGNGVGAARSASVPLEHMGALKPVGSYINNSFKRLARHAAAADNVCC